MARDRARSSFTVEVRRGRSTPVETDPKRALWRGLDLAGEGARHDAVAGPASAASAAPARDVFAARQPAPAPGAAPRILPSLIEAPAPAEDASAPPETEERLPRVRRARAPRPTPEPIFAGPDLDEDPDEVFDEDDDSSGGPALVGGLSDPGTAAPRLRRREPRGERVLRAGERWKRRLPRALW